MYIADLLKHYLQISLRSSRKTWSQNLTSGKSKISTFLFFSVDLKLLPREVCYPKPTRDKESRLYYSSLMDILNKHNLKGTFFVNGEICVKYPELISDLYNAGHEIGAHGFYHESFVNLWPITIKSVPKVSPLGRRVHNIRMSKRVIRNIIGQDPVCFRAPYLAIDGKTLRILEREGFLLDSSLYNSAFGRLSYPYHPSEVDPSSEGKIKLWEVPVTISPLPRKKLFYWRYPGILELEEREIEKTVYLLERIFLQCKLPFALFVILIHPYDLGSPKIISRLSYFLALMKDMKAVSLTASQLIKKLTINVGKNVCV